MESTDLRRCALYRSLVCGCMGIQMRPVGVVNSAELIKLNDLKSFWEDFRRATVRWIRGDAVCVMDRAGVAGEVHSTGIGLFPGCLIGSFV